MITYNFLLPGSTPMDMAIHPWVTSHSSRVVQRHHDDFAPATSIYMVGTSIEFVINLHSGNNHFPFHTSEFGSLFIVKNHWQPSLNIHSSLAKGSYLNFVDFISAASSIPQKLCILCTTSTKSSSPA